MWIRCIRWEKAELKLEWHIVVLQVIDCVRYSIEGRIAVKWMTETQDPPKTVDHLASTDSLNDQWSNLRPAAQRANVEPEVI